MFHMFSLNGFVKIFSKTILNDKDPWVNEKIILPFVTLVTMIILFVLRKYLDQLLEIVVKMIKP